MEAFIKIVGTVALVVGLIVGISFLVAYPTMWLVNYLITSSALVAVFGIPALTFWKAFWLNFLCSALFKSTSVNSK